MFVYETVVLEVEGIFGEEDMKMFLIIDIDWKLNDSSLMMWVFSVQICTCVGYSGT